MYLQGSSISIKNLLAFSGTPSTMLSPHLQLIFKAGILRKTSVVTISNKKSSREHIIGMAEVKQHNGLNTLPSYGAGEICSVELEGKVEIDKTVMAGSWKALKITVEVRK
jgi:hypothetical protein